MQTNDEIETASKQSTARHTRKDRTKGMTTEETQLPGVVVITPDRYGDDRGLFMEVWHKARYGEAGVSERFVQDNVSRSQRGVLRGLHYQLAPSAQGKLVSVWSGRVWDVAVDLRADAPTFGEWVGIELSAANGRQLYVPEGCAHGFVALSEDAVVHYKCTSYYAPKHERTIRWNDPDIAVDWPVESPMLSEKDAAAPLLAAMEDGDLPA
jgi:dTDP-4-dehydrorhamnose 3,5-epimerase